MAVDTTRVEREFTRHIRAEEIRDPFELAAYPDFDIEPMPLVPWLKDATMLSLKPLSPIQLEFMELAERILFEPTFDALGWSKRRSVFDLRLAWGKGSGKDYVSRILLSRAIYLLYCLASPQAYFGMPGSETISVTNIATAAPQAKHIFFDPWVVMLERSRFFREIMEPKATHIDFDKGLLARSGHSSVESQEGQNLIVAVLDEIAAFKTATELSAKKREMDREPAQSAEGVVRMARSSIRSRFPLTGKMVSLSFTRFKNDMIDLMVKEAAREWDELGKASRKFGSRAATWEVNPLRSRSDFDDDYRDDPADARGRYECRPEASTHRFFKNGPAVRKAMGLVPLKTSEPEKVPAVVTIGVEYYWGPDPGNKAADPGWQVRFDFTNMPVHHAPLAIHLDLGISHDQAGVAGSRIDGYTTYSEDFTDPRTGLVTRKSSRRPKVVTNFIVLFSQVSGDPLDGTPDSDIQVRWIRQLVFDLMNRGWKVGLFTADGYQSTDTFQLLQQFGIETELYSLDRKTEGYDVLKNLIYGGDITVPWNPLLFAELESLVKMTETRIDHQAGMSKDLADAWAGSARGAIKMIEDGTVGAEMDGWTGASIDEITNRAPGEARHVDVDGTVKPRWYADDDEDSDFWAGGGLEYND